MSHKALFLDRDGVINVDHGYVCRKEQFDFVEGIFDLVALATRKGILVVVVTNQAGIGRGYYSEDVFRELSRWMCEQFASRDGSIARIYHCPYHPEHGIGAYRRDSSCRKPAPGMILKAQRELNLDLTSSVLVGDNVTDIQAGVAAGVGHNVLLRAHDQGVAEAAGCLLVSRLGEVHRFL